MNKIKTNAQLPQAIVMTSYYLVRYSGGSYEDAFDVVVFATNKKSTATKYTCEPLPAILEQPLCIENPLFCNLKIFRV